MAHPPRSFFSVELCFPFTTAAALHTEVRKLLQEAPAEAHADLKWRNHRQIADLLLQHISSAVRGCWEYMDDDGEDRMWDDWLLPLTDRTRQPAGHEAGGYFTVTMMMQCCQGTRSDRVARTAFKAAGDQLWTSGTFASMLESIPAISFGGVIKDALYLMPRDHNAGFTDDELKLERMKYLRLLG
jgi:hypothetical protein